MPEIFNLIVKFTTGPLQYGPYSSIPEAEHIAALIKTDPFLKSKYTSHEVVKK
jgi:hypothetical protein